MLCYTYGVYKCILSYLSPRLTTTTMDRDTPQSALPYSKFDLVLGGYCVCTGRIGVVIGHIRS